MDARATGLSREERDPGEAFRRYLKPGLGDLLASFGLDVCYHRAEDDRLFYRDATGHDREVADFVGGFGASLLGHNHPELVEVARQTLERAAPFHAQASIRVQAGLLAERLAQRVSRSVGGEWVAVLANTGTEATEVAIKHAELERSARIDRVLGDLRDRVRDLRSGLRDGRVREPDDLPRRVTELTGGGPFRAVDEALDGLLDTATAALEAEPVLFALERGFHGKTTGSLKLTHKSEYRRPWRRMGIRSAFLDPRDPGCVQAALHEALVRYPTLAVAADGTASLSEARLSSVVATFVEPVQGEGGVREVPEELLRALRVAADEWGFPLVFDEIQCGLGRCGTFLASERPGVRGDYYLFSKALGGGLAKVSALLVERDRYHEELSTMHTSTFAEDELSSAVALRVLEIVERDSLEDRCDARGRVLRRRLSEVAERFPRLVREVRGRGLMVGVALEPTGDLGSPLLRALSDQELLAHLASGYLLRAHGVRVAPTLSAPTTLRLEPSAYVTDAAIDRLCSGLEDYLRALEASDVRRIVDRVLSLPDESPRRSPPRASAGAKRPTATVEFDHQVAFLAHFTEPGTLRTWEPGLAHLADGDCERLVGNTLRFLRPFVVDRGFLRSPRGPTVRVDLIGVPFTSEQALASLRAGSDWALDLVREAVELAREGGNSVAGLGGHTSIVTGAGTRVAEDDMALTSGNSLTVAAAYEAACTVVGRTRALDELRVGVAGASGNVGAMLAELASEDFREVVLVGTERHRPLLARVAERIAASAVRIESIDALRDCDLVFTATNSPGVLLEPEHIGPGPVVICDVAIPPDVSPLVTAECPNATVLRGGIVLAPEGQELGLPALGLEADELYGCLAETILLGLARRRGHYSYGRLNLENVRRIQALAREHGFRIQPHHAAGRYLPL